MSKGLSFGERIEARVSAQRAAQTFGRRMGAAQKRRLLKGGIYRPQDLAFVRERIAETLSPLTARFAQPGFSASAFPKRTLDRAPFWVFLPEGEERAAPVALLCLAFLREQTKRFGEVQVLTLKNVRSFVELPRVIEARWFERTLGPAALADFLRAAVLSAYGGVWVDPFVLFLREPDAALTQAQFYGVRHTERLDLRPDAGMWDRRLIAAKADSRALNYVREAYILWWEQYDAEPDDALFDHFLYTAVRALPDVAVQVHKGGALLPTFDDLAPILNAPYDPSLEAMLLDGSYAFPAGKGESGEPGSFFEVLLARQKTKNG